MADTFTAVLNLTKPEVGASTDTWGTKVNADLDTIDGLFDAGPVLKLSKGGTGAATAAGARTALGLAIGTDVLPVDNPIYTGTLTGGTGVVNLGSGQFYKDTSGNLGLGVTPSAWGGAPALDIGSWAAIAGVDALVDRVAFSVHCVFFATHSVWADLGQFVGDETFAIRAISVPFVSDRLELSNFRQCASHWGNVNIKIWDSHMSTRK